MIKAKAAFSKNLVAPCGMNCGTCSGCLAYTHNLPRARGKIIYCTGCRLRNKQCAWLKGHCEKLRDGKIEFCFQCQEFPCERLSHLDERYRRKYQTSFIKNLKTIKEKGIDQFQKSEQKRWRCPKCGGVLCIHNNKCYDCGKVTSWKG